MANGPSETKIVSLSTKITVIVFWGLILVGLVFAAILFQTMEETTLDGREGVADKVAYRIHEALDYSGMVGNQNLTNEIHRIGIRHPELHMELHRSGKPVMATSRDAPASPPSMATRPIRQNCCTPASPPRSGCGLSGAPNPIGLPLPLRGPSKGHTKLGSTAHR